jgi:hypothetical protein
MGTQSAPEQSETVNPCGVLATVGFFTQQQVPPLLLMRTQPVPEGGLEHEPLYQFNGLAC